MSLDTPGTHATGWTEVLGTLERALDRWLAHAVELAPAEPGPHIDLARPLRAFEERLDRLQAYLDRAEGEAQSADAPLTAEIDALGRWLEALGASRRNLAGRAAGAV